MEISQAEVPFQELERTHEDQVESKLVKQNFFECNDLGLGDYVLFRDRKQFDHEVDGGSHGLLHLCSQNGA